MKSIYRPQCSHVVWENKRARLRLISPPTSIQPFLELRTILGVAFVFESTCKAEGEPKQTKVHFCDSPLIGHRSKKEPRRRSAARRASSCSRPAAPRTRPAWPSSSSPSRRIGCRMDCRELPNQKETRSPPLTSIC